MTYQAWLDVRSCIFVSQRFAESSFLYRNLLSLPHRFSACIFKRRPEKCFREVALKFMEEKHSLVGLERAVSLPPPPSGLKSDAEELESKKQNCLCAPTTHVGSFRCRLHRRPPPSPIFSQSQHAVKKGLSSQKLSSPKVKVALHQKIKQGCGKRPSSCSTSARIQQELPAISRLSRTSVAKEQKQSSWSNQESLKTLWKTSSTVVSGDEALQSEKQILSSDASGEELSSSKNNCIPPLVKLPSI